MPDIVILRPCPAETGGGQWRAGLTYTASDGYARVLIGRGDAYDPSGVLRDIGASSFVGAPASEAAMLALGATQGSYCYRTDTATFWDCISTADSALITGWLERGVVADLAVQTFYFSAAGTYIVANGPATAYSLFLTTSVVGTVRIYDNTAASGPDVLGSTATAVASNVSIPIGTAPTYGAAVSGLCLVVSGANVGYLTWGA
jgi:fructose-1,6-bisphosphatase/inositol monophosphatase family enzyme